jgi:hypothetical protein
MEPILAWGLDVVRGAQSVASPALTSVMKIISGAGTELFFLAALPLIYWCIDKRRGIRIGVLLFLSTALNTRLKLVFGQPRPYDLDSSVGMAKETTYGLPSGHAQASAVFALSAAPLFRAPWGLVFAVAFPLLVGISRIYLGVHFPTDVLAGWAIGAAIVALDHFYGDKIARAVKGLRETLGLACVAAVALVMNLLTNNDGAISGAFFGLAGGAIYADKTAPFSVAGGFWKRLLRFLFGMLTVAIVYAAPKLLLAELGSVTLLRFLRYALLGSWVVVGAPWLFLKMGLADREGYSANEKDGSVISK